VSFILDALRKSEHERQRSTVPGLSQVPLATPEPQLPRWASIVMGVLAAVVLVLGGAWWASTRGPGEAAPPPRTVERGVELPPQSAAVAPQQSAPLRPATPDPLPASREPSLASAAEPASTLTAPPATTAPAASAPAQLDLPADAQSLPSAAALAAEGIALPTLRLELHAFNAQARNRFVFINGRKYVEGERLVEGPMLVSITSTGAVLMHSGRRFLLVQE
jgi:general secretion pathway protein B